MSVKKTIWLKQLSAVFLLLVLAAVSVVQVSHSHNAVQQSTLKAKYELQQNGLTNYHQQTAESKCFICEYQLAKDVDACTATYSITATLQHPIKAIPHYWFIVTGTYSFFETRGPPQLS